MLTADQIKTIQESLNAQGFFVTDRNGEWTLETARAYESYCMRFGINPRTQPQVIEQVPAGLVDKAAAEAAAAEAAARAEQQRLDAEAAAAAQAAEAQRLAEEQAAAEEAARLAEEQRLAEEAEAAEAARLAAEQGSGEGPEE